VETLTADESLDRRGKTITTFVVFDAAAALQRMQVGERLEVLTEDRRFFEHDIEAWCRASGHTLVATDPISSGRRFLIEKGTAVEKSTSLAMVISMAGLEELLSPLAFALAAALEGIEVNLYVQGPAVRVLSRGFQPKLQGWARPFSRFAAADMAKSGHIPAQAKLRQLRSLGAHIYMCAGSMDHFKVSEDDLIFDDLPQVEYLTFMAVMESADIHIYT
jgi:TusA-related sulfurtransferase/predicted peroxiredoxin